MGKRTTARLRCVEFKGEMRVGGTIGNDGVISIEDRFIACDNEVISKLGSFNLSKPILMSI